jgi:tetratricopeptide (TPR) repeat protein
MTSSFLIAKIFLLTAIVVVPLATLLMRRLRHGSIMIPNSGVLIAAGLLPLAYLGSALFAVDKSAALLSLNFNTDSFGAVLLGFLMLMLVVLMGVRKGISEKLRTALVYFIYVILGLFILQTIAQIASLDFLSWVALVQPVSSWLDVAALIGLLTITTIVPAPVAANEEAAPGRMPLILTSICLLLLGFVTHVMLVFVLLAIIAGIIIGKDVIERRKMKISFDKKKMVLPLLVLCVSLFFITDTVLLQKKVTNTIQSWTQISFVDVRPNWQGTLDVAKKTVSEGDVKSKVFGPGVGSFSDQWRVYKPVEVNTTDFWNTNFSHGIGFIPTSMVTGGAIVLAGWALFLLVLFWAILRSRGSLLGMATGFMWLFAIYTPISIWVLLLTFVLTGLFVLEQARARVVRVVNYKLRGEEVNKVVAFVIIPVLFLGSVAAALLVLHRGIVNNYLLRASDMMVTGDLNKTEQLLNKAKFFTHAALVEQGYTKIGLARLSALLEESGQEGNTVEQETLQQALSNVLSHAQRAIEREPQNPANYIALGNISEQLITLNISGAAESAIAAYEQAIILDPYNPSLPYFIARVYGSLEDSEQFVAYLEKALSLKPNFTPALYQYGVLEYSSGNAEVAVQALGQVVQSEQNNANALYYLALALDDVDRIEEALLVMKRVLILNPENAEVADIVMGLEHQMQARARDEVPEGNATDNTSSEEDVER